MLKLRLTKNPLALSILAALLTLGLKYFAYRLTGSVGLLSEALESLINLVAALTAFFCLWYAAQPVDVSHTYGHDKIEFFSSGLEGVLICAAAVGIAWYSVHRLVDPEPLQSLDLGLAISLAASLINLAVARVLLHAGRARHSIVMEADGRHLMTDVWTSAGVLAGLVLVLVTGVQWLDPVIALMVAANIAWTGFDLVRISFNGLMDHALPEAEQAVLRAVIATQLAPGMDFHALRTRVAGSRRFADFHLLVPGALSVRAAHEVIGRIEAAVRAALPGIEVAVHVEPIEERAAWEDSELLPLEQAARQSRPVVLPAPPPEERGRG
jgi:cation diffusion facilitator family transporter